MHLTFKQSKKFLKNSIFFEFIIEKSKNQPQHQINYSNNPPKTNVESKNHPNLDTHEQTRKRPGALTVSFNSREKLPIKFQSNLLTIKISSRLMFPLPKKSRPKDVLPIYCQTVNLCKAITHMTNVSDPKLFT
ncbi:hypothetical protein BpHYR1_030825 [Brachionus plicatilis]|uniref:Uncharacterized protein n=1 Tax=Brachionus plicatilis TaxID=10195 RepID=A0A3M7P6L5_BRAPC|nr:hypothetical protein BpHYR1_030825 [Brachionus plicatilis]